LHGLGNVKLKKGEHQTAGDFLERSLIIRRQFFGNDHHQTAHAYHSLGNLKHEQGEHEQAETLHIRARDIFEKTFGSDHHHFAKTVFAIANIKHKLGDLHIAHDLHEKALRIRKKIFGDDHHLVRESSDSLKKTKIENMQINTQGTGAQMTPSVNPSTASSGVQPSLFGSLVEKLKNIFR
jgi:tetratricopeptide (TPR) repeat protein